MRNDGGEWRAALKSRGVASEVGIYQRLELEEELAGANLPAKIDDLPKVISTALAELAEKRTELTTICVLDQTRQLRTVTSESLGRTYDADLTLMQLYLDEIGIRSANGQPILAHAYKVEVELAQGIDLELHMGEACRIIWHEQFMSLLLNEAGVRYSTDPEYVHTLDAWMSKRADAHRELVAWFDAKEYGKFVREFLDFCRTPGAEILDAQPHTREQVPPFQVRHVVPAMLLDNFAHVRCYEVCFEGGQTVQLPTLHQLRIECKYLRYNLEFVRDLLGEEGNQIINALKMLQDNLGDLNDAVVSKELLTDAGDGDNETVIARYESAQDKTITKLRDQVYADFVRFVGPENRQRILSAIARL
jgi:hypothetical protein